LQLLVRSGLNGFEVLARFRGEREKELPGDFAIVLGGSRAGGDLVLVDKTLVEARGLALPENLRCEVE